MKTVKKNATIHLFAQAEKLFHESHDGWRCIHINLADSRKTCSQGVLAHFVQNVVEQLLADLQGTIYFCEDRDIIILFKAPLATAIKKLSTHFAELNYTRTVRRPSDEVFMFYDLNQQWKDFFQLCREKYLNSELNFELHEKRFQYPNTWHQQTGVS